MERPETVSAPPLFERPEPSRLLNDWLLMMRFVVDAVRNEEYEVDDEYEEVNKPLPPIFNPPAPMVEARVVEVALKLPKVGVEVETKRVPSNESKVLSE